MHTLAVAQLNSQSDIEQNMMAVEQLLRQAQQQQAALLVLPENVICFAQGMQQQTAAQFEHIQTQLAKLAHHYQLWIVAGSIPCPYRPDGTPIPHGKVRSCCLVIQGDCAI